MLLFSQKLSFTETRVGKPSLWVGIVQLVSVHCLLMANRKKGGLEKAAGWVSRLVRYTLPSGQKRPGLTWAYIPEERIGNL